MPAASDAPTPAPRRGRLAPPGDPTPVENVATHLQEGWNRWQRARALRAGNVPTVMAFTGYGSTSWGGSSPAW